MAAAFVEVMLGTAPWILIAVIVWALIGIDDRRMSRRGR